jgi:hypothetical protein
VTLLVLVAVVSPALRDHDSFPLSTYPMYAGTRPDTVSLATAAGIDATGERTRLSLRAIARTDDPLIGQATVERAIDGGSASTLALCREVAGRVPDGVVRVEVVTERHDVVALAAGRDSLVDRTVHATCEVPR